MRHLSTAGLPVFQMRPYAPERAVDEKVLGPTRSVSVIHEKHSDIYLDRPGNAGLPARGETTAVIYGISLGRLDKRRIAAKFRVENRGL